MRPSDLNLIEKLGYIPVGLGNENFSENFFRDNTLDNISEKNRFYGEYTFHYWLWKNYLDKLDCDWVGFCQYRKFFAVNNNHNFESDFEKLNHTVIKKIDDDAEYDCILGKKFSVTKFKFSKIIKNYLMEILQNPSVIFNIKKRNLKFHFDLYHGKGNLDAAIKVLDDENKFDFNNFVNNQTSFNPHNMFICKTNILKNYYEIIFPWLEKCENIFGFNDLKGYGIQRIYGFLAERFLSYWFTKNYKVKELHIIGQDLASYRNL